MAKSSKRDSKAVTNSSGSVTNVEIDEEAIKAAADAAWEAMDKNASFADFEKSALAASNDFVRQLLKKKCKA